MKYTKCLVIADIQARREEPHFTAFKNFLKWVEKSEYNRSDTLLFQLGDLVHHKQPHPDVYAEINGFITDTNFAEYWLLSGNHEYSRKYDSNAINPFSNIGKAVRIIDDFEEQTIGKTEIAILPWKYTARSLDELKTEIVQRKLFTEKAYDYLFYHFADETTGFDHIDLSFITAKNRVGGDIHKQSSNYLGTPFPTRKDERGQEGRLMLIDFESNTHTYIKVPMFLDYREIAYGKDIQGDYLFDGETVLLWDVLDAPSYSSAMNYYREKYNGIHLNNVRIHRNIVHDESGNDAAVKSMKVSEYLDQFIEKNKVDKVVKEQIIDALKRSSSYDIRV